MFEWASIDVSHFSFQCYLLKKLITLGAKNVIIWTILFETGFFSAIFSRKISLSWSITIFILVNLGQSVKFWHCKLECTPSNLPVRPCQTFHESNKAHRAIPELLLHWSVHDTQIFNATALLHSYSLNKCNLLLADMWSFSASEIVLRNARHVANIPIYVARWWRGAISGWRSRDCIAQWSYSNQHCHVATTMQAVLFCTVVCVCVRVSAVRSLSSSNKLLFLNSYSSRLRQLAAFIYSSTSFTEPLRNAGSHGHVYRNSCHVFLGCGIPLPMYWIVTTYLTISILLRMS